MSIGKCFKVIAGEARFGKHYKMKGITTNTLDIKISSSDTWTSPPTQEEIKQVFADHDMKVVGPPLRTD